MAGGHRLVPARYPRASGWALLIAPLFVDLSDGATATISAIEWFIWAAFAVEYGLRLCVAPGKLRFVRREWVDLLVLALPLLRPLRVVRTTRALRLLRLARVATVLGDTGRTTRLPLTRPKLHYALAATGVVVLGSAALVAELETSSGGHGPPTIASA